MTSFTIETEQDRASIIYHIQNEPLGSTVTIEKKKRTSTQNASIHLYATLLASSMNDSGMDKLAVYRLMREGFKVEWTLDSVKSDLWRPIQVAMFNTKSTTKLDTTQVNDVYMSLNRWTNDRLGISLPFPNRHEM